MQHRSELKCSLSKYCETETVCDPLGINMFIQDKSAGILAALTPLAIYSSLVLLSGIEASGNSNFLTPLSSSGACLVLANETA